MARETASGFILGGNAGDTFREEEAPKGESQERCQSEIRADQGSEGVNRQGGDQTSKTERSGRGKPAPSGPPSLECAEGSQSPGEEASGCLGRAGA